MHYCFYLFSFTSFNALAFTVTQIFTPATGTTFIVATSLGMAALVLQATF